MIWSSPYFIFGAVVVYLIVTILVVYRYHSEKATEEDYYVAGRDVGYIPNSFSIVATLMSGGIYLGTVGWFYLKAWASWATGSPTRSWRSALVHRQAPLAGGQEVQLRHRTGFLRGFLPERAAPALRGRRDHHLPGSLFRLDAVAMGTVLERFAGIPYLWGVLLLLVIGVGYTIYGGCAGSSIPTSYKACSPCLSAWWPSRISSTPWAATPR